MANEAHFDLKWTIKCNGVKSNKLFRNFCHFKFNLSVDLDQYLADDRGTDKEHFCLSLPKLNCAICGRVPAKNNYGRQTEPQMYRPTSVTSKNKTLLPAVAVGRQK